MGEDGMDPPAGSQRVTQSGTPKGERAEAVRIWLLGGFQVSVGSRSIESDAWRLRKAASLLKLLALAPGHRLHREQAMDLLWPGSGRKAASNNLRQTLHATRRILDPAVGSRYLASEDESLVLCSGGSLWVDVDAFEEAVAAARRSRDPAAFRAAIDLYSGELLPEDRYEQWAEARREELRRTWLSLHIELSRVYEERRDYEGGIEVLQKAISKEPTNEEAHSGLMRLYALSGRREDALRQYERLREVLSRELSAEPDSSTQQLHEDIADGRFPPVQPTVAQTEEQFDAGKHNLPAPRGSFVGREREMVEIKRTLAMTRLLTLTGAGGSGKTRLALEVARSLVGAYPDGVWLVELAPLSEGDLVAQEVAGALEISERPGEPLIDTLVDVIGSKNLLVVLDNCEHLVEAAARLVDTLLDSCPYLRLLATSREPLGVGGEVLWRVPPLSLPDQTDGEPDGESALESLVRYEAVRLFVDRARLRLLDFKLTQENAGAVLRVCRKLDGIPLAIELATARMGALAVEQVAQRLDISLDLLKGASRTAAPRQQTLRATLDWSYDLLSEIEQALFLRLSVFAGSWSLEAAEAVCSGGVIEHEDVLDLVGGLVDKSLVVVAGASTTGGAVRYRMLEPIHEYARERLEERDDAEAIKHAHAELFLALTEEAEPMLLGAEDAAWLDRLEQEHDNMRAALSWTISHEKVELALRLGGALQWFWYMRGYFSEGRAWLEQALAKDVRSSNAVRIKALEGLSWLANVQGDLDKAEAIAQEGLRLCVEAGIEGSVAAPPAANTGGGGADAGRPQAGTGVVGGRPETLPGIGGQAWRRVGPRRPWEPLL
jgi:predicted ATPase/DNA-binding SARP family transcriptional activator